MNSWFLVGGTLRCILVSEGVSLGDSFEVSKESGHPQCSPLSLSLCVTVIVKDVSSQLLLQLLPDDCHASHHEQSSTVTLGNCESQIISFFCKLPLSWYLLTATEKTHILCLHSFTECLSACHLAPVCRCYEKHNSTRSSCIQRAQTQQERTTLK